jgi:hypothetical protein
MYRCNMCSRYFMDPFGVGKPKRHVPSPSDLILRLRALQQKLGRTPTVADIRLQIKQGAPYREQDFTDAFGGYLAAIQQAKLPHKYNNEFTETQKDLMLVQLRRLSRMLRAPISSDDVRRARKKGLVPPVSQLQKAFGSIALAIKAAGVSVKWSYTTAEMLDILRKLDKKLDRPVMPEDVDALYRKGKAPSSRVMAIKLGGFKKARAAAGVRPAVVKTHRSGKRAPRYSREELIGQLQRLKKKLRRVPRHEDIFRADRSVCASVPTFAKMFGGLKDAYRAAGFTVKPFEYTEREALDALKRLKRRLGHFPTHSEMRKANREGECPHPDTIRRHLGPLEELRRWI